MTEVELRDTNPWYNVAQKYKGNTFLISDKETYVCEEDRKIIEEFNEIADEDNKFHLNIPAYPWYGNPLKANVIILSMNPAWNEKQDVISKILLETRASIVEGFAIHLRNILTFDCAGLLPEDLHHGQLRVSYRDIANLHQSWYWQDRLVKAFVKDGLTIDEILNKCAIIQYIPYSSRKHNKSFKPIDNGELFSQKFTKELIQYILKHHKEVLFIIPRNVNKWLDFLGPLKNEYKHRFIQRNNPLRQSLTPKDSKDFDRIITEFMRPIK